MSTESPTSLNAQDFSGSDDEIIDNFLEGPNPNDDGTPMGLGGEKEKQSEPASSTLEADIVNGTTKQSGEKLPPENPAGEPEPVQEVAGEKGSEESESPEPETKEPETPEFSPALLQMAGLTDASAAQVAGFQNPEALFAAIKWRGQLLTPEAKPAQSSEQGLYRRPAQPSAAPPPPAPEATAETKKAGKVEPFQLPSEKIDMLDEDVQAVLRDMNQHYQQEVAEIRASISQRDADQARRQEQDESMQFDEVVQNLGEDWRDVFGEGTGMELSRTGPHDPVAMTNFNHRALLFETVEAVREVNTKQGYKPMTLEQEVQWALMQRYPDKFQKTISGNSNGKSGHREGVTASRPTQRNTPPKSRSAKVLSDVDAMLNKQHGYKLDMGQEDELDGEI